MGTRLICHRCGCVLDGNRHDAPTIELCGKCVRALVLFGYAMGLVEDPNALLEIGPDDPPVY